MEARYLHMTIEELVEDTIFIQAIRSKKHHAWSDWINELPAEAQKRVTNASLIVSSLSYDIKHHAMEDIKVEELWSRIDDSTKQKNRETTTKNKSKVIPLWAYISSIAAAIALFLLISNRNAEYKILNSSESPMALVLPSESNISLSQESTIQYDKKQWSTERNIRLDGRASFDVTKGVPFNVYTDEGSVHVLGTAFEVVEREDVFLVAVDRGLVRVESGLITKELGAGMSFLKNPDRAEIAELKGAKRTDIEFQNGTFKEAKLALEEVYNITFEGMESEDDREFNGGFDSSDLEVALKKVVWPYNLKYKINKNVVTLSM